MNLPVRDMVKTLKEEGVEGAAWLYGFHEKLTPAVSKAFGERLEARRSTLVRLSHGGGGDWHGDGKAGDARSITNIYEDPRAVKRLSLACLLYTSPSPRDATLSRMPSSA